MVWPPRSRRGQQGVRQPDFPLALFLLSRWYRNSKAGAGSRPGVCVFPRWHGDRRRRKQEQRGTRPPPMQQRSGADLQPLPERSVPLLRVPPPAGVSPPPELICMALPLPRCHWPAPRPAHCPSVSAGFRPPSRPELRAAGGLLNRGGGGGWGGSRDALWMRVSGAPGWGRRAGS